MTPETAPNAPQDTTKQVVAEILPDIDPSGDSWAGREVAALAEGKLNRYRRQDNLHGHLHNASVCFVWLYFIAMGIMGGAWLWHLVTPEQWAFLSEAQRDKLQTAFFSAVGSSALTDKAKKIGKSPESNDHGTE